MVKIFIMIKRNKSLTKEQFRSYYEDHHANFALRYIRPYLTSYCRNYPKTAFSYFDAVESDGKTAASSYDFDCITEMCFADESALEAMFARLAEPGVRAAIAADEERFIDPQSVIVLRCDEGRSDL